MPNVYHQPETQGRFSAYPSWPYGAAAAIVEVDPETGHVKILRYCLVEDAGTIVNPLLVDANLHGGIAQGIGGAMFERIAYDEAGQPLTATFMDYTLPTAVELPRLEIGHQQTPAPFTPLGTKGVGESGVGGTLGSLCSAIENALPEARPASVRATADPEQRSGRRSRTLPPGSRQPPEEPEMLAADFEFHAPTDLAEALQLLVEKGPGAKILAGGMSMVPTVNLGLLRPECVVSLNHVAGLDFVDDSGEELRIGALVRHARIVADPVIRSTRRHSWPQLP